MNKEIIKSWSKKILPVIVTYLVSKGWIGTDGGDLIAEVVDAIIIIVSAVPTIISSTKTHKAK